MKKIIITSIAATLLAMGATLFWFVGLFDEGPATAALKATQPSDLEYLTQSVKQDRGRILIVVSSTPYFKLGDKRAGYELTELSRAYYVFRANGFEVEVASPLGGKPPARMDWEDFGEFDYAFVNDKDAQALMENTLEMSKVDPSRYEAAYFVGGKGAMYDFPDNPHIQALVRHLIEHGKVVSAVCHGPAALVNVKMSSGELLIKNRKVTGLSNIEETFIVPNAQDQFPFWLESKLIQGGGDFSAGPMYLNYVVQDGNLLTGQNPWSVWPLIEGVVRKLGYEPIPRKLSADENTVNLLLSYHTSDVDSASKLLKNMLVEQGLSINRNLLVMHSVLALWRVDVGEAIDVAHLAHVAKSITKAN